MGLPVIELHGKAFYSNEDALNLGALYIKEYLNNSGLFDAQYFSDNLVSTSEELLQSLLSRKPAIIGFSLYSWNIKFYEPVIKALKSQTQAICFAGGPFITDAIKAGLLDYLDFAIIGPGEVSTVDALKYFIYQIPLASETGIITKQNFSEKKLNELSPQPTDFHSFSVYLKNKDEIFKLKKKKSLLFWETARGCKHNCSYCRYSVYSLKDKIILQKDLAVLQQELDLFKECELKAIAVLTPTFDYDLNIAKEILREIIKRFKKTDCFFTFECKIEHLDEEIIDLFSQINCLIETGPQSLDSQVLSACHRPLDQKKFLQNLELCNQKKVRVVLDLIYGLPEDTLEKSIRSLNECAKLTTAFVNLSKLSVPKNTELFLKKEKFNLTLNPSEDIYETPSFTKDEILYFEDLHFIHDLFAIFQGAPWETSKTIINFQGEQQAIFPYFRDVMSQFNLTHTEGLDLILRYFKYFKKDKNLVFVQDNITLWKEVYFFLKLKRTLKYYIIQSQNQKKLFYSDQQYFLLDKIQINNFSFEIVKQCFSALEIDLALTGVYQSFNHLL